MNPKLLEFINALDDQRILEKRKQKLLQLSKYLNEQDGKEIGINFICTHNSRRSQLAQVWAQTAAHFFGLKNITSYSGGTESTAIYPQVLETLKEAGFEISILDLAINPTYEIKFAKGAPSIKALSKEYNHKMNPKNNFVSVVTCSEAEKNCPFVPGAKKRFSMKYEDPKAYDNTSRKVEKYFETSMEIANELFFVFSQIN